MYIIECFLTNLFKDIFPDVRIICLYSCYFSGVGINIVLQFIERYFEN